MNTAIRKFYDIEASGGGSWQEMYDECHKQNLELKATIVDLDTAAGASAELMVRVMELEEENGRLKEENKKLLDGMEN